jgi:hypothetical protein
MVKLCSKFYFKLFNNSNSSCSISHEIKSSIKIPRSKNVVGSDVSFTLWLMSCSACPSMGQNSLLSRTTLQLSVLPPLHTRFRSRHPFLLLLSLASESRSRRRWRRGRDSRRWVIVAADIAIYINFFLPMNRCGVDLSSSTTAKLHLLLILISLRVN